MFFILTAINNIYMLFKMYMTDNEIVTKKQGVKTVPSFSLLLPIFFPAFSLLFPCFLLSFSLLFPHLFLLLGGLLGVKRLAGYRLRHYRYNHPFVAGKRRGAFVGYFKNEVDGLRACNHGSGYRQIIK